MTTDHARLTFSRSHDPRGFMRLGPLAIREPFETEGAIDIDPMRDIDHTQERG